MRKTMIMLTLAAAVFGCDDGDDGANPVDMGQGGEGGAGGLGGEGGAGGGAGGEGGGDTYAFASRFVDGESSVVYSGQTFRHVLIADLASYVGSLTGAIDGGDLVPVEGDIIAGLDFYFSFDGDVGGTIAHDRDTTPAAAQTTYNDIASGKNLVGKLAGNDPVGQHADWSTAFIGWPADGVTTPESLVRQWFADVEALAIARAAGELPMDPSGAPIAQVYVSATGLDYQQLIQKFLLGAIAFSQGADDYLDDSDAGKGLLASNATADDGAPYSALEHAWDEGFGYFGAAQDYAAYTDDEIASSGGREDWQGAHDSDGDGAIDLISEVNWGASVNAAKRDRGAVEPTDFTGQAFAAFRAGRALIASVDGELDAAQMEALKGHRDAAVDAWEKAIAATAVHYINDVLQDMAATGEDYSFLDHAKHWSELKGFALSLQFNPRSPVSDADFAMLHDLIGAAPALPGQPAFDTYAADLIAARTILGNAYGFAPSNLGDANGEGGW